MPRLVGHRPRGGFTLIELIVVIAIIAVLVGLSLGAVQRARAVAARMACANKLRQVGLAAHGYHGTEGRLPPGCSAQVGDPLLHATWMTRLLPQLEQGDLWRRVLAAYKTEPFFEAGPHLPILATALPHFACPADPVAHSPAAFRGFSVGLTSYMGSSGLDHTTADGVLYLNSAVRLGEIPDGTSSTLLAGERPPSRDRLLGWWYAGWGQNKTGSLDSHLGVRERNVHPRLKCPDGPYPFAVGTPDGECDPLHFWSLHSGGANFAFCDGSVRFLTYSADSILPALATRAGGEIVSLD